VAASPASPAPLPNWSPKQQSFIKHSNAFINLAHGATRAGKTHSSLIRFVKFCGEGPPGRLGIFGKTERTIEENVIIPLRQGLPNRAVQHVKGSGMVYIFGRACRLFGAHNIGAVEKVQGATLSGGYMNEATLYDEDLFNMAISRSLSVPNAKWFADCNPDSPYHWMYQRFVEGELPSEYFKAWHFKISDNPILPPENVAMLGQLYGGPGTLFYRRFIDGEWVMAIGAIYDMLDITPGGAHVVREVPEAKLFERVVVGVDYGTANDTVFLAAGKSGGVWTVFSEDRYSSTKAGRQRSDTEHSAAFGRWLERLAVSPSSIEVDPSAASFKVQLRQDGHRRIRGADHDVIDGIRTVQTGLTSGTLKIHVSCEDLIKEMSTYAWDEAAGERGKEQPIKANDHGPDALRYLCMRVLNRPALRVVARDARL
jgi:PBSX family phage terminase large subunit